jgi:hypothetical protein
MRRLVLVWHERDDGVVLFSQVERSRRHCSHWPVPARQE